MSRFLLFTTTLLAGFFLLWAVSRPPDIPFRQHVLDLGANETCTLADINGDGRLDILSGENWYEAPSWRQHRFRSLPFTNNYIDNFSDLSLDVNGDGRMDVVSVSWFSRRIAWFENPGLLDRPWREHLIDSGFPVEFAILADLDNDGKALELLPQSGSMDHPLAWYELKGGTFVKHVVSPQSYGHGIGAGDVNGDGRTDILTPRGWWQAPADPRAGAWQYHAEWNENAALSFLYVYDIDGDGLRDVVSSHAHDYGVFWLRNAGSGKWEKRMIDESWSQAHALTLIDLNKDGRPDLLTGKRYMAHNGRDPGEKQPLGLYWYEFLRNDKGHIEWVRHLIDYGGRAGGGMQLPVADLDGDGDLDFVAAGKSGLFLYENLNARKVGKR